MEIERTSDGKAYEYLVWEENYSRVIATARLEENGKGLEIKVINVSRECRGRGIGTELLNKIVSDFTGAMLLAWVFQDRVSWYTRNGFREMEKSGDLVKVVAC